MQSKSKTIAQFDIRPTYGKSQKTAKFLGDSNIIAAVHSIGSNCGVYTASWKSAAWSKISAKATRLTSAALREKLELSENVSVTFSRYAGCSMCPCSPGFIIRGKNDAGKKELREKQLAGHNIFGDLLFDKETLNNFKKNEGEAFLAAFELEKQNH